MAFSLVGLEVGLVVVDAGKRVAGHSFYTTIPAKNKREANNSGGLERSFFPNDRNLQTSGSAGRRGW
jgi:hypothetical protein